MSAQRDFQAVAGVVAPPRLRAYRVLLAGLGFELLDPDDRAGLHPLLVPIARAPSGATVGLLCWPTAPPGFPVPVAQQASEPDRRFTLDFVAPSVDVALHRELALRDVAGDPLPSLDPEDLAPVYAAGAVAASGLPIAAYRLTQIGETHAFHEELVERHLARGATLAAQVTADRALRVAPGWARPMAFRALLFARLGDLEQARDSAAAALADPVWTLGHPFAEVAALAGWRAISSAPFRRLADDLGKPPADRAAHLLDALAVEGGDWGAERRRLAALYAEAGLGATAALVGG
jgi:hypothetical protein